MCSVLYPARPRFFRHVYLLHRLVSASRVPSRFRYNHRRRTYVSDIHTHTYNRHRRQTSQRGTRKEKEGEREEGREIENARVQHEESWRAGANKQVLQVPRSLYLTYATINVAFLTVFATSKGALTRARPAELRSPRITQNPQELRKGLTTFTERTLLSA